MMSNLIHTWYTGDWKINGNKSVPYNGISITAAANYSPITSPPTSQKLISINLDITDFTLDKDGVSSTVSLEKTQVWYDIPLPQKPNSSPPVDDPNFTVSGSDNDTLGKVMLDHNLGGVFLNIQFCYGVTHSKREEIGFIMKFDELFTQGDDPIVVEL